MAAHLAPLLTEPQPRIGVAVSGGGDSVALLHLLCDWARGRDVTILAATVDHGLRPAAADEARGVAQACAALGVRHVTLPWRGWDRQGNVQAMARAARRRLLRDWAGQAGLCAVTLGHTADDQAETVLMRLARGSGVDGLGGMVARDGVFLRPLLGVSRASLRDWLMVRGLVWVDDPSNDDTRFDRVKARQMLTLLAPLGLTVARLTDTADHMARARVTLWQAAADWAQRFVRAEAGDLIFAPAALDLWRSDVEARVFAAAVQWIGSAGYRPRYDALLSAARAVQGGQARTLGGVALLPHGNGGARLTREAAAVQGRVSIDPHAPTRWDGRWYLARQGGEAAPDPSPWHIAALGAAGLLQAKGGQKPALPRASLLASPAIWAEDRLISAPLAGFGIAWQAKLGQTFHQFILSH